MSSEQETVAFIDDMIAGRWYDKRFSPDDERGKRKWATLDASGHVTEVNWEGESDLMVSDDWLAHLANFSYLQLLHLDYNPDITGSGLIYLRKLRCLKQINLASTAVGDASVLHLSDLESLEWLRLNDTGVGDIGLTHLSGLRSLIGLELFRTPVSDLGLSYLHQLNSLEHVNAII